MFRGTELQTWAVALATAAVVWTAGSPAAAESQLILHTLGNGTVFASPPAIGPCGTDCLVYPDWTLVTITQSAAPGWEFEQWRGAGIGDTVRAVTMDSDQEVTAVFRQSTGTVTRIEVSPEQIVNEDVLGLGSNFHIMFVPEEASDRAEFFQLLGNSGQRWLRVVPQFYEWEGPGNDDANPWTPPQQLVSSSGFAWNRGGLTQGFKSLLDYCEAHDIWLEINNWETVNKPWLDPDYYTNPASHPIPYARFAADAEEFGENLAALIYHLKTRANGGQGYNCVKYWAVWNEPGGGHDRQDFVNFDFPGTMNLLYEQVDAHLRFYDQQMATNVRDQVKSIGFEGFPQFRHSPQAGHPMESWEEMVGRGIIQYLEEPDGVPGEITQWPDGDPNMDIIAIHDYWSVLDYDSANPHAQNQGTLQDRFLDRILRQTIDQIKQYDVDGQIEPVFVGEIGSKSYKSNPVSFDQMLFTIESSVRALTIDGVKAVARWSYNTHYEWSMVSYPGFVWETPPVNTVHPVPVTYYPFKLVSEHIERHSDAVATRVVGGLDSTSGSETWPIPYSQRVWASSFLTPGGDLSLVVINDSYEPKNVRIVVGPGFGAPITKSFVTATSFAPITTVQLTQDPTAPGELDDTIPARSILVYRAPYQTVPASCADEQTVRNPDGSLESCSPYICSQGVCLASCASQSECAGQYVCDAATCIHPGGEEPICRDESHAELPDGTLIPCVAYVCRDGECLLACENQPDCATGYECGAGICRPKEGEDHCLDAWTLSRADGTEQDCLPYRCVVGACQTECANAADCVDGFHCEHGRCEQPVVGDAGSVEGGAPDGGPGTQPQLGSADEGGCSTSRPGARHDKDWLLLSNAKP